MITFEPGYVRLVIREERRDAVTASISHLLFLCRANNVSRALILSQAGAAVLYSSLREAVRFHVKGPAPVIRWALVLEQMSTALPSEVRNAADISGIECEAFSDESEALHWLQH